MKETVAWHRGAPVTDAMNHADKPSVKVSLPAQRAINPCAIGISSHQRPAISKNLLIFRAAVGRTGRLTSAGKTARFSRAKPDRTRGRARPHRLPAARAALRLSPARKPGHDQGVDHRQLSDLASLDSAMPSFGNALFPARGAMTISLDQ
jgi:hypothetical protein